MKKTLIIILLCALGLGMAIEPASPTTFVQEDPHPYPTFPDSSDYCDPNFADSNFPWPTAMCYPNWTVDISCALKCLSEFELDRSKIIAEACQDSTRSLEEAQLAFEAVNQALQNCLANGGTSAECHNQWTIDRNIVIDNYNWALEAIHSKVVDLMAAAYRRADNCLMNCCIPPEPEPIRPPR